MVGEQRLHKGRSLFCMTGDFTVVDIETTGLNSLWDDIIELGAIRYRNGMEEESFSSLINPGTVVSGFISGLTGITNEMLASAPALSEKLPEFMEFVGKDVVVGHNVNFDVNFIYDKAKDLGLPYFNNNFVDTMRISRRLFREYRHHRLCDLAERFCIMQNGAHRVLSDCDVTAKCYIYMQSYISERKILLREKKQRDHGMFE